MSTNDKFLRAKAFGKSYELDQAINELSLVLFKDVARFYKNYYGGKSA